MLGELEKSSFKAKIHKVHIKTLNKILLMRPYSDVQCSSDKVMDLQEIEYKEKDG